MRPTPGCGPRIDAFLITDYPRARQMAQVLADLSADKLAAPTPAMRQFVARSVKVSRPRHRRRRSRAFYGAVGAAIAIVTVAVAVPAIANGNYDDKESIVTTGNSYLLQDLPQWSAANSAALLLNGTPTERALAQVTLVAALNIPWELDALQWQAAVTSAVPFDGGRQAIVSVGAGLIVLDVRTQQALWTAPAPAGPYYLSVDPQGQTAVGLGPAGAIVVNLATHAVRRVAAGTDFADGQLGRDGVAVVRMPGRMPGPRLAELNTATGTVSYFGAYPGLISVSAGTSRGPATALVFGQAGNIDLIRLPDKTVLASVPGSAVDQTAPRSAPSRPTGGRP